jgi:hypothetical protein
MLFFEINSAYFIAAAAPIDLPQRINLFTLYFYFRVSMTAKISFFSLAPKEIDFPSELPQPVKSKLQNDSPIFKISLA